jgi:ACS family tartrate transporter-like MFS transporter
MSLFWLRPPAGIEERTRRRVTLYLIPYLFFLYILAYLDRVNVSVAGLEMQNPVSEGGMGFDEKIIGIGFGIFFFGYWILEIPSTLIVVWWGARWVFVRVLVLWGMCAAVIGLIGTPFCDYLLGWLPYMSDPKHQFYFLRFMLGVFEGGFFPSVIFYFSYWFRAEDRGRAIALFMAAIPLTGVFGLPLSGQLLKVHWFGLPGWRWIFILEGIVPILAGFATIFLLPDRPAKARWLPAEERDWLNGELDREHKDKQSQTRGAWIHHFGFVLLLTIAYFCLNVTSYGLQSFMPAIIKSQSHVSNAFASALAGLPYLMGFIGMLLNGWHSDRTGERFWHAGVPMALSSCGVFLAVALTGIPVLPVLVMIFCIGPFMYAHLPGFWPIPTKFLGAAKAASAIGFINMIGNLGGQLGPYLVGTAKVQQADFAGGLLRIAPWPLLSALIIFIVAYTWPKPRRTEQEKPPDPQTAITTSANPASAADRPGCEA